MSGKLRELAAAAGIPTIETYGELELQSESYDEEKIFALIEAFGASYGVDLVLYGGLTATERIYGFKSFRDITTDLDFVCTEGGIRSVAAREARLYYHRDFDILFGVRDNVPISFAWKHIHDWPVEEGFFAEAKWRRTLSCPVRCCAPEYSIMLKMRCMEERLRTGKAPFGKDALDIINMTVAPSIRADLEPVDFVLLGRLLKKWVCADVRDLAALTDFIAGYREHLTERESPLLKRVLERFSDMGRSLWKS